MGFGLEFRGVHYSFYHIETQALKKLYSFLQYSG